MEDLARILSLAAALELVTDRHGHRCFHFIGEVLLASDRERETNVRLLTLAEWLDWCQEMEDWQELGF